MELSTKKYRVLDTNGVMAGERPDAPTAKLGDVIELNPEAEQTKHYVAGGFVEEVVDAPEIQDPPAAEPEGQAPKPESAELKMVEVKLTQEWSDHKEGDVISLDAYNAGQLIEAGKAVAVEQE